MMALASPTHERQLHVRASTSAVDAAYGTFDTDDELYSREHAATAPASHSPAQRAKRFASHITTMRAIALVGVFVFGVSCMLLLQDEQAPPTPVGRHHSAAPTAAAADHTTDDHTLTPPHAHVASQAQHAPLADALALQREGDYAPVLNSREQSFLDAIDTKQIREYLHAYASVPHPAGSKQDYATAVYTAKQFESFGINATIKEYYPLLSTPVRRHVAIVAPAAAARELNLTEGAVSGDACTTRDDALPPFLAYAASGNVTASVVYVNFGTPADFAWLVAQNVTLRGKIALVRYGRNYRGLKVMVAEQHGMAGVLIYSDPMDDGYGLGPVYPAGPWRPADSFQRGGTMFLSLAPGDPLTPGYAANLGAPYLSVEDASTIPHIPALPLSYGQAQFILKSLGGTAAPAAWQGALAFSGGYRIGDDEATVVNVDLEMDNKVGPIWNVMGTIDGAEEPAQHVIIGNHRDAWVCGAVDPSSGSAVMLELARGLGKLLKSGWRPRRTLVLGSWDGEEPGLLGSTEFVEDNAAALTKQAVAYINVDAVVGSVIATSGTPSIASFLLETAKAIPVNQFSGNETATTLFEQWREQTAAKRALLAADVRDRGTLGPDHMIGFLGSGTDFTPFYQHLGIVSANVGFAVGTAAMYGTYHSTMDSLAYVETVGDPNYTTQETTAKWWGLLALRLADATVLPFDYTTYGPIMADALAGFKAQVAANSVAFTALDEAIERFQSRASVFERQVREMSASDSATDAARRALNAKLVTLERHLLTPDGLPHRPWFKHVVFGPGFYEGYSGTAFPGIDDAIAFGDSASVIQEHVNEVARVITRAADVLLLS